MNVQDKSIRIKAVIWDYGNTLVLDPFPKTIDVIAKPFTQKINGYGYSVSEDDFKAAITEANKTVNYPFCTHFTQEEPIIQRALEVLGVKAEDAALLGPEFLADYRRAMNSLMRKDKRNEEVRDVLAYIKEQGIMQAVFSNDRKFSLNNSLKICGFAEYFDLIKTSEEIGIEKPDTRVFDYVLKELGILSPEDAVYIGDDPKRDVEAPKKKGMKAILYERPKAESIAKWRDLAAKIEYEPDIVIKELREIMDKQLIMPKK